MQEQCPLCLSHKNCVKYHNNNEFGERSFLECLECHLIFVPKKYHISSELERSRYQTHNNSPMDKGYVDFLNQLIDPLITYLNEGDCGLDFGCGPGPAIDHILSSKGIFVDNYDPYFFNDKSLMRLQYDFVTSTEVLEHLSNPREDITKILDLVKPCGYIGIMTLIYDSRLSFGDWWYKEDPTHIMFYQNRTFQWIASWFNLDIMLVTDRVIIFRKSSV